VGGVVVHDNMDVEPVGDPSIDLFEEVQELRGAEGPSELSGFRALWRRWGGRGAFGLGAISGVVGCNMLAPRFR
jgi:hypothetical protein